MGDRLQPALVDRIAMLENRLAHLAKTSLTDQERVRASATIEWEYRRGVCDDISQILGDQGRFNYRRGHPNALATDITDYITRRPHAEPVSRLPAPAVGSRR